MNHNFCNVSESNKIYLISCLVELRINRHLSDKEKLAVKGAYKAVKFFQNAQWKFDSEKFERFTNLYYSNSAWQNNTVIHIMCLALAFIDGMLLKDKYDILVENVDFGELWMSKRNVTRIFSCYGSGKKLNTTPMASETNKNQR